MNNTNEKNSISDRVLGEIRKGQVKMQPKWRFALGAVLILAGIGIILLVMLYLASFVIFVLRETGVLFVPDFGIQGWQAFFSHTPWYLIFFILFFVVFLEIIIKRYALVYRRPLIYSALGIIIIVVAGGILAAGTSLHGGLSGCAHKNKLPVVGEIYREVERQKIPNIQRGQILNIYRNDLIIKNRFSERLSVIITSKTRLPWGADFIEGDYIVVFGDRSGDTVRAFGIRKIENPIIVDFCN